MVKRPYKGSIEFYDLRVTHVSDCETSLCGDDDVMSASRTPTIIGDSFIIICSHTQPQLAILSLLMMNSLVTSSCLRRELIFEI